MTPPEISIVIPVYRSAAILPTLHAEIVDALKQQEYEIIFVHDCGPDNSWSVIKELAQNDRRVIGINLRRNCGQHNAIMAGLHYANGNIVVTMDDDLQHSPSDLPALLENIRAGFDVCYAVFDNRRHAAWKRAGSRLNNSMANYLLAKPPNLYLSPFKAFSADIRNEVIKYAGPSVYLDGLILGVTRSITTVNVAHHRRLDGDGGYSIRKSASLFLKMATMTSIAPLRLATMFGFLVAAAGLVLALALVGLRLSGYPTPLGWTSILVVSLLMSGVQLIAIGVIGEYVGKTVLEVRHSPQFVLAETINAERRPSEPN